MQLKLSVNWKFMSAGAETDIFRENKVNAIAADGLATHGART